ncbi:preprotein translocase subunit SecA, partial [Weissella koreensis]
ERDTIINQNELNHKQFVYLLKRYAKNIIDSENYDSTRFIFDFIDESYNIDDQINIDEKISDRFNYVQNLLAPYPKAFEEFVNQILLKSIDTEWVSHVDKMQQLRLLIDKRVTGQKNPLQEYQEDSQRLYKIFRNSVDKAILKNFMLSRLEIKNNLKVTFP